MPDLLLFSVYLIKTFFVSTFSRISRLSLNSASGAGTEGWGGLAAYVNQNAILED
jgi:hypothetical protein